MQEGLRQHFRPEFLNRLDETIIFDRLEQSELSGIIELQIQRVAKRMAQRGFKLEISDAAVAEVASVGYDGGVLLKGVQFIRHSGVCLVRILVW